MPDARLARARRSLPAGYQFGDARPRIGIRLLQQWDADTQYAETARRRRRASDNAAEQLARQSHWNVIEGEHFGVDEAHDGAERTVSTPARGLDD